MRALRPVRLRWLCCALGLALLAPLIMVFATRPCAAREPVAVVAAPAPAPGEPADPLAEAVHAAVGALGGGVRYGVAMVDERRGGAVAGTASDRPFFAASLAKLIVAVDLVQRGVHRDGERDTADVALIRRMLGPSDDAAMNEAWVRYDGPGGIERVRDALGLRARVPAEAGQWGETVLTAADVALVYRHVLTEVSTVDRDLLLGALDAAPATATDGFDQRYGLLGLPGARYAKQGWMYRTPRAHLHSAGLLDDGRVLVLLADTASADPRVLAGPLTAAARAAADTVRR